MIIKINFIQPIKFKLLLENKYCLFIFIISIIIKFLYLKLLFVLVSIFLITS